MDFVGQHAAHILALQSGPPRLAVFRIAPRIIGDTKVVIRIAGGKIVYEPDSE